jgi:hypothetical protein
MELTVLSVYVPTLVHSPMSLKGIWRREKDCKDPRSPPKQFVVKEGCVFGGSPAIWELLMDELSGLLEARPEPVPLGVILQNCSRARERCTCVRCRVLGTSTDAVASQMTRFRLARPLSEHAFDRSIRDFKNGQRYVNFVRSIKKSAT